MCRACCSPGVATQLDECRLWLRATQGFVLQLQKQVQGFADEGQPSTSAMEAGFSLQEAAACSTAPNSAASLNAWRSMCQEASDALGSVAETMSAGGAEVRVVLWGACTCSQALCTLSDRGAA